MRLDGLIVADDDPRNHEPLLERRSTVLDGDVVDVEAAEFVDA